MKRQVTIQKGLILVLIFSVFFLAPTNGLTATRGKPIKIGFIDELTAGVGAMASAQEVAGARLAVQEINKAGGVLGRPLELIVRDDRGDPGTAARVAKDLIISSEVDFLAGTNSSTCAAAISEIAKTYNKLFIIAGAQTAALTEENGHRYVARGWSNAHSQAGPPAYWAAMNPWTKYTFMCGDYSWGRSFNSDFKKFLREAKPEVKILDELWPKFGETDYTPFINKIIALEPECLVSANFGTDTINFIKQAKAVDLFKKMQVIQYMDQDIKESLGKEMPEGIATVCAFQIGIDHPWVREFVAKIRNDIGVWPGGTCFMGYLCPYWLKAAIEKARTTDTEKVIDAFDNLTLNLFLGKVTLRPFDHQATGAQWVGLTKHVPEYPFAVSINNLKYIPGEKFLPSVDEVKKMRQK
jgi:branched-chain amino acid transport system substrate-binding protein